HAVKDINDGGIEVKVTQEDLPGILLYVVPTVFDWGSNSGHTDKRPQINHVPQYPSMDIEMVSEAGQSDHPKLISRHRQKRPTALFGATAVELNEHVASILDRLDNLSETVNRTITNLTEIVNQAVDELMDERRKSNAAHSEVPPWIIPAPTIIIQQHGTKKGSSASTHKQIFMATLEQANPTEVIYTDGSKTDEGVGAALVTSKGTYKFKLNDITSIYTAEQFSILQATNYIKEQTPGKYAICTDSLSTLLLLRKQSNAQPLIREILTNHQRLQSESKEIIYIWSPGHIGIRGNEQADSAARQAIQDGLYDDKVCPDDLKSYIKIKYYQQWQREWHYSSGKLRRIKPTINKWSYPKDLKRREQEILFKMLRTKPIVACRLPTFDPHIFDP
ncbi:unnamed protein product, partial [Callosobruchus maculatus]